jgi:hypothetical protein
MPTLITPRMLFLHVPKTGGTWVSAALAAAGVEFAPLWTRLGPGSRGHATLEQCRAYRDDRFSFAYVRHPLDLLRSRWAGSMRDGWPENRLLHAARADDFATFAERVVARYPGFMSRRFEEFTGPADAPISFVGRYETLVDDLVRALEGAGERFDEAAVRGQAPLNRNDYTNHQAVYDLPLARLVAESEHVAITRWYAEDPLPARLLRPA